MKPFPCPNRAWLTGALCAAALTLLLSPAQAAVPPHPVWERIRQPLYPRTAVARAIEGELLVEYSLDAQGKVVEPRVVRANPPDIFDQTVLTELKYWRHRMETGGTSGAGKGLMKIAFLFQVAPCASPPSLVVEDAPMLPDGRAPPGAGVESMRVCVGRTDSKGRQMIQSSAEADEFFMKGQLRDQVGRPEYVEALSRVETDKATIRSERTVPHDANRGAARRTLLPVPAVHPQFRRALTPGSAMVTFDVDGSGRVVNISWPAAAGGYDLAKDLAQTVSLWLFEPKIEDGVGIRRVGLTAGLIVEFEETGKTSCGHLKTAIPVDIEQRICLSVQKT